MQDAVAKLWPEIQWIEDKNLRDQVTQTWIKALERSPLKPDDLNRIPFTLLVPNCPITFMEHKRCVVHIARQSAEAMQEFMGRALPIDMDTVIAGAILADVGKLLEYELGPDGKSRQSERGEALRHPFTGVALALECGVPDAVCHIIAAHAAEGDLVKRTTEAYIVHHADFMAFLPFKNPKNIRKRNRRVRVRYAISKACRQRNHHRQDVALGGRSELSSSSRRRPCIRPSAFCSIPSAARWAAISSTT